jgi:catechol 2,3-dioxygenase-like lactoylglutathione lyase family enzyme
MLDHMILTVSNVERSLAFYEAALKPLNIKFFLPWLHHFRRLVTRWEYHIENFFGMVRLGCKRILFRYL